MLWFCASGLFEECISHCLRRNVPATGVRLTGNDEEVDDLAGEAHDTINATNQQRRVTRETNSSIENVLVVLDDRHTTKLSQGLDEADEAQPLDVLLREQHQEVAVPFLAADPLVASLEGSLLPDLDHLLVDELLALVRVDPRQDGTSFLESVLGDKPTRCEGKDHQATDQHEDGAWELQAEREPPLEVALEEDTAVSDPVGQEEAHGRSHPLEADDYTAVLRFGDLGHVDGRDREDHARRPTGEQTPGDEHANVGANHGQQDTHDGNGTRDRKGVSAAEFVGGPAREKGANSLAGIVDGNNGTCKQAMFLLVLLIMVRVWVNNIGGLPIRAASSPSGGNM